MKSLRGRLAMVLGLTFALCWASGVATLVTFTSRSERSVWDSKLQAFATRLLLVIPADIKYKRMVRPGLQLPVDVAAMNENFGIQVWNHGTLIIKTPSAPDHPFQAAGPGGFSSTVVEGKKWRTYAINDHTGQVSVQVANLQSVVDWEMQYQALTALSILTAVLAVAGGLLWYAMNQSLRPVAAIQEAVRQRKKFDLTPLPVADLPLELQPLVDTFNHVLTQLDEAVGAERRFIGDAAHELRTPLAALQAQAEVALRATTPAAKDAALEKLLIVAKRSTRLAEQMLDLARLDAGVHSERATMTDLGELIQHVAHEYEFLAALSQRDIIIDAPSCHIICDLDEVAILLRNLVDNAVRHAPADGRIRIACAYIDGGACLEVADDGPGVPEAERAAIFKRFHRIDGQNGRGSGIGLSLVAGIAQLHGAQIVTGTGLDGRGFSVRVNFPRPPQPARQARATA